MALTNATRLADFGSGISGVIQVDNINERIGIGTDTPQALLQVGTGVTVYGNSGIVSATAFYGSAKNLTGIAATDNVVTNTLKVLGVSTFVDNVSIGETLTYEDVTNIDSLGIITARTGVNVTAGGINAVGVVTATSFSGDGSNLTGVESGVVNFVASGTIANGATVIIKDDGTVGIITQTTSDTPSAGDPVVFEDGGHIYHSSTTYDSANERIVVFYEDYADTEKGKAVVGTVSGDTISFGTPVEFSTAQNDIASTFDSANNKVVVAWAQGNPLDSYAKVGTVDPTDNSITFGSAVQFGTGSAERLGITFDSTNERVVITYRIGSGTHHGKAIVGTVSGTGSGATISFATEAEFNAAYTGKTSAVYDSTNGKVVVAWTQNSPYPLKAAVGTVDLNNSPSFISFGSVVTFTAGPCDTRVSATYVGSGKVVVVYRDDGNSYKGTAQVGTVVGTGITFGDAEVFDSTLQSIEWVCATYDSTNDKVVVAYRDNLSPHYGYGVVGIVTGTDITFGSPLTFESANTDQISCTFDNTNDKTVIAYNDQGNNGYGTAVVFDVLTQTTNLTAENYIGIAGEAIANGATGKVNVIGGVNSGQSGLTTAKKYYVSPTGILTTTAGTPSVVAGTSISSTKIKVR